MYCVSPNQRFLACDSDQDAVSAAFGVVLDLLPFGVVILSDGDVQFCNRAAMQITAGSDGLVLRGQRVCATRAEDSARLSCAIGRAAKSGISGVLTIEAKRGVLQVAVLATQRAGYAASTVVLVVADSARMIVDEVVLRGLFGLTPTEAKVAAVAAAGRNVDEVASELGAGRDAVKYHLKNLFVKTGVERQSELVSLVLRSVAILNLSKNRSSYPSG